MKKKKSNYKNIFKYFLILLLLVVATSIYLLIAKTNGFTQTKETIDNSQNKIVVKDLTDPTVLSETNSWKTYVNKKHGFQLKYPADKVVIYKEHANGDVIFTYPKYKQRTFENIPTDLQILYRGTAGSDPIEAMIEETPLYGGERKLRKHELVKINNAIGVHTLEGVFSDYNYYLTDENKLGTVIRVTASSYDGKDIELLSKMIKTLQFVR